MQETKNIRWWIAAGACTVLLLGFVLPRFAQGRLPETLLTSGTSSTAPPQLLAGEQSPAVSEPSQSPVASELAVYVCGSVHRPGVYRFASGLRVADAIARAGGALADADLKQINLAQPLSDAMKVDVPKKGQIIEAGFGGELVPGAGLSYHHRSGRSGGRSSHKLQPGQTLDVNTATESELTSLPGVGPGLARRIIEYRQANGPFQTVDDLQNVSGIGPSKFARMEAYIRL